METRLDPKYNLIKQLPYCCVPTCIQMILSRRGLDLLSQREIGIDLGLAVPRGTSGLDEFQTDVMPPAGWGTRINEKRYELNNFFKRRNIPLWSRLYQMREPSLAKDYIGRNLALGNDLLVCFRYDVLYPGEEHYGHGSLVESLDGENVTLVDPRGLRREVSIQKLTDAVKMHHKDGTKLGGVWSVTKLKKPISLNGLVGVGF